MPSMGPTRSTTFFVMGEAVHAAVRRPKVSGVPCGSSSMVMTTYFGFSMGKAAANVVTRSEEHTSELQSLMRISYAVFCLKKKNTTTTHTEIFIINNHIYNSDACIKQQDIQKPIYNSQLYQ